MEETKAPAAQATAAQTTSNFNFSVALKGAINTIKDVFVKPYSKTEENVKKFDDAKNLGIFAGIAIVLYLIISLINALITTMVRKSCSLFSGKCETKIDSSYLENFKFFDHIGNDLISIVGVIAIISVVVYVLGLVFKKQPKFLRLIGIATAGYAPVVIATLIGTILGYFWSTLSIFVVVLGLIIAVTYIISANDREMSLDGDKKLFFHIISSLVIFIIAYLIVTNIIKDAAGSTGLDINSFM